MDTRFVNETADAETASAGQRGQVSDLRAGHEEYGLPVLKVREIIKVMDITAGAAGAGPRPGVINLRGKVIPVIDLRLKFGFATQRVHRAHLHHRRRGRCRSAVMLGIIVDSVSEVLNIAGEDIDHAPDFGDRVNTDYMLGLAKVKGTVKILLDLDRVLGRDGAMAEGVLTLPMDAASPVLGARAVGPRFVADRALVYEHSGITPARGQARAGRRRGCRSGCGRAASAASGSTSATCRRTSPASELTALLDAIATNHTAFFREPQHFEFLARHGPAAAGGRAAARFAAGAPRARPEKSRTPSP